MNKYLKYKNKYLNLKQKGGFDSETQLIKEFVEENRDNLFNFPDYSIDEKRKIEYIEKHKDSTTKFIISKLVNNIRYISSEEFNEKIKELCDIYNKLKKENDVYILIIPPQILGGGGFGGALNTIFRKSNFYVTLLSSLYLKYDYIIDISKQEDKDSFRYRDLINKLKKLNLIEDDELIATKNIQLFYADDCSYSGTQIRGFLDEMKVKYYYRKPFQVKLIVPYFLNEDLLNDINVRLKIQIDIIEVIKRNNKGIFNTKQILENSDEIKCYLTDLYNKYLVEGLYSFGRPNTYLIYFNHKFADAFSINQVIIPGKIIKNLGETDLTNTITNNINEDYYPFIKNCDKSLKLPNCPLKLYDSINYSFKGQKLNLKDIDNSLINVLIQINK